MYFLPLEIRKNVFFNKEKSIFNKEKSIFNKEKSIFSSLSAQYFRGLAGSDITLHMFT